MPEKRIDAVLRLIKEQGYVTVKYLCDELHYSTATINRDLNDLQKKKLITRHYGGAEIVKTKGTPLVFRYHKMRPVKRLLAKKASEMVKEGMTVFIDGSTTAQYIGQYIKDIKGIKVITNNLNLISYLSESGVKCICLGGDIIEMPYITGGIDSAFQAKSYHADISFFSTGGISSDGRIYDGVYLDLHRAMVDSSEKSVFLIDHKKLDVINSRIITDLSEIDVIISDLKFGDDVKKKYKNTQFMEIETPKTQKEL